MPVCVANEAKIRFINICGITVGRDDTGFGAWIKNHEAEDDCPKRLWCC